MLERLPVRRHVRRLALLALAALALASMPGLPARAQVTTTQPLDDTQVDFAQGTFQRTAVSAGTVGGDPRPFPDQDGTLELSAAGNLNPWAPTQPGLPEALAFMGSTTIGARLYSVAGVTSAGANAFTDAAYWANVDRQTGALADHGFTEATRPPGATTPNEQWVNDPLTPAPAFMGGLPPNGSPFCTDETIRSRRAPAVASFVTGTGTDYIYVIGGAFNLSNTCGSGTVTSSAVQIGAVNAATGDITWSASPTGANYLPSQNLPNIVSSWTDVSYSGLGAEALGVEGATASVVTAPNGQTYLYVIGGLATYDPPFGFRENLVTPAVFYTRLDPSTGALENPTGGALTPWARGANVPLNEGLVSPPPPGELGIYNHTAIVSRALVGEGTGTTANSAIFVTGGYTDRPRPGFTQTAQAKVFRATVQNDGSLVWQTSGLDTNPAATGNVSIDRGRAGLGGFAFGNKLYILGGTETSANNAPLGSATVGVHDDAMGMLPLFGSDTNPVYFSGGESQTEVIDPAYGVGAAVLAATPPPGATTIENAGWGYAIGGNSIPDGQTSAVPSATIFRGQIGGSAETEATTRIPDGWYYSRFFNIRFESENLEARILSVRWFTGLSRGQNPNSDVRLEFQRTKVLPCNEAAFAGQAWVPLDGSAGDTFSSREGFNEVKLRDIFPTEDFNASCFRYRVYMTQNGSADGVPNPAGNANLSPQLFSINVEKVKPGDPDLKVEAFEIGPDASGRIATFDLKITNLNDNLLNTIAIIQERFPVVLCVAYSPSAPPELTVPDIPVLNDPDARVNCAPVYRWIDSSETIPGQTFTLNNNWQVNFDNVPHIPGRGQDALLNDPKEAFAEPGYYAVGVMLDPFNLVPEGGAAKTNNRGENLNNGQPLVRRFQITQQGFDRTLRLPLVAR